MTDAVAYAFAALALGTAAYAALLALRDKPVGDPLFYAVAVVELALIGVLVGGIVALTRTTRDVDGVLFVSYLVTNVVIPPAALLWGIAENSRWGSSVLAVAMLTVAVLSIRILGIWQGRYV